MPATVIVPHISGGAQTDIPDTSSDFSEEDIRDLTPEQARKILYELRVHQEELISQNEELRAAQESLEISRARYFDLYHLAPVGYLTLNEKGVILTANLTAGTLLGQELKTMTGQPFAQYILPADNDIYYLHRRRLFETGQPQVCEIRMIKQGGNWFWAHIETTLITVENNTPTCHAVISDITNRKQAEETRSHLEQQLHHVMKAESLGRMAGAIAHHFNNLLAIVIGNLELAKNEIMQGSRLQTFISESLAASHRAAETSSLMLAYIGDTMGNREPTDLLALCSSILPLCITALPHNRISPTGAGGRCR